MTFAVISPSDPGAGKAPSHQRARGRVAIGFVARAGKTVRGRHFEEGAAKVRYPRPASDRACEAILINTAGGLAGGDSLDVAAEVGDCGRALVTTQAAERVYRSISGPARVSAQLTVGANARLDWLPQETILFDRASLRRNLEAEIAADGRLLVLESFVFGRTAMGESVANADIHDRWRIRRAGKLVLADDVRFAGAVSDLLNRPATLAGGLAMATLAYVAPDAEELAAEVAARLDPSGGASAWDGKLVARCVAADGFSLRRILTPVLGLMLGGADLPRSWVQ